MLRKTIRADRGLLIERSVVQSPNARLLGGAPNAAVGLAYYIALAIAVWFVATPALWWFAVAASALAAIVSAFLAYSLLFVTRMPCAYCWTSHTINWSLLVCTVGILLSYWR